MRFRLVLLFLIVSLLASHAFGVVREVPIQYQTIGVAIAASAPLDTVLLNPGLYREQITVNTDITIASRWIFNHDTNSIYNAIWMPDTGRLITVNRRWMQLIGIYFLADETPIPDCGVMRGDSSSILIDNCRVFGTYDSTWNHPLTGSISLTRSSLIVRNSVVKGPHEGSCRAIMVLTSGVVYLSGSSFLGRRNSRDVTNVLAHGSLYVDSCYFNHGGGGLLGAFLGGVTSIRRSKFINTSYYTLEPAGAPTLISECIFDSIQTPFPFIMIANTSNGDTTRFSGCEFQNYLTDPAGVLYYGGTPLVLSNCIFRNNNAGVLWETDRFFADSCIFEASNPQIVTGAVMNPVVTFQNCDFSQQSVISSSIWRYPPSLVTAPNCYWGDPSGPQHPQNPNGLGTVLPAYVNPFPFRTAPVFPENGIGEPGRVTYSLPNSIELLPAYPNPFNSSITIRFRLPKPGDATVAIYDLTGREVVTLHHGYLPATSPQTIHWQPQQLASGKYFIRLQSNGSSRTGAVVYSK